MPKNYNAPLNNDSARKLQRQYALFVCVANGYFNLSSSCLYVFGQFLVLAQSWIVIRDRAMERTLESANVRMNSAEETVNNVR